MADFPTFKGSWLWPWIGSWCIPSCITRRPLPTHQISLKSKKLFVDGRTDGRLRPTLLGRLGGVDQKHALAPVSGTSEAISPIFCVSAHCDHSLTLQVSLRFVHVWGRYNRKTPLRPPRVHALGSSSL